jgi:hypothetical protein
MKNFIFPCLLVILFFISKINSEDDIDYSKICGRFIPDKSGDCNRLNTYTQYCCYLENALGNDPHANQCIQINSAVYSAYPSWLVQGGKNMTVNCGVEESYPNNLKKCGKTNPLSKIECSNYSTQSNSCCYFNYGGSTGCYSLGSKYIGSTTYGNYILQCDGTFMKYTFSLFFIIILILVI